MANVERFKTRRRARTVAARGTQRDDYWFLSTRPLHSFAFLLPLVVLYELGSIFYLHDLNAGMRTTVRAENLLRVFFDNLGVFGLLVPGLTVLLVLLVWHVVVKDRWQLKPMVMLGMYLEAALWALPLLVLASILSHAHSSGLSSAPSSSFVAAAMQTKSGLLEMPWPARATVSLGAGIYEELVFRLAGLAITHAVFSLILTNGLKLHDHWAKGLAIVVTAVAFAFYHDVLIVNGRGISITTWLTMLTSGNFSGFLDAVLWRQVLFFTLAGAFFAAIYLWRGFGIVVGTHAAYDLAVLVFLVR